MAPKTSVKPYKLKATEGPLSRDDLTTWEYNQLSYCRQTEAWQAFLPGGTSENWKATDDDETNGFIKFKQDGTTEDPVETNKLRSAFKDFLTCVAVHCPTGFTETVQRESTCWKWIINTIKDNFSLNTKGEQFLGGNDIKFVFDDNFTYQQAYMFLWDYYSSAQPEKGKMFKGKILDEKAKMSPLTALFIVEKWLSKIDSRLPAHVYKTRGHLFTDARPTLACNQRVLCDQIDVMLAELDGASSGNVSGANVNVGQIPSNIGYVPNNRAAFAGGRYPAQRGLRGFRGQGRAPSGPRQQRPVTPSNCLHCLEAKRYDASITHPTSRCQWVTQRPQQQRPQLKQQIPGFKVLLVPNQQAQTHPNLAPDQTQHTAYINQLQQMSLEAQSQAYSDQFQYPDTTIYDYQYQAQEDPFSGASGFASVSGYPPGSLEEL